MSWILFFFHRGIAYCCATFQSGFSYGGGLKLCDKVKSLTLTLGISRAFTVLHILAGVPKSALPCPYMKKTISYSAPFSVLCTSRWPCGMPTSVRGLSRVLASIQGGAYISFYFRHFVSWYVSFLFFKMHSFPVQKPYKTNSSARLRLVPKKDRRLPTCWPTVLLWG